MTKDLTLKTFGGRTGLKGFKGIDHWHLNEGIEHLLPGSEIPGGECPERDQRSLTEKIKDALKSFNEFMQRNVPVPSTPTTIPVLPGPFGIPVPVP